MMNVFYDTTLRAERAGPSATIGHGDHAADDGAAGPGSRSGRVERKRAERRAAIVEAASALIARDGAGALTAARLAAAVDLTPGALYRYFSGMDEIIAEVLATVLVDAQGQLAGALRRIGLAPAQPRALAALLLQAQLHAELALKRPERFALLTVAIAEPRQLVTDEVVSVVMKPLRGLVGDIVEAFATARRCGALDGGDGPLADVAESDAPTLIAALDEDQVRALTWLFAGHGLLTTDKIARRAGMATLAMQLDVRLRRDLLRAWGAQDAALHAAERLLADTRTARQRGR